MSQHEKQGHGESIEWNTPRWILERLGEFDLDPCGNVTSVVNAKRSIMLPDDGLVEKWEGRVWLNPPFGIGIVEQWFSRWVDHGNGIAILPARVDTALWNNLIFGMCDAVFFFRRRVQYDRPNGEPSDGVAFPSALIAIGADNVESIRESGFSGFLLDVNTAAGRLVSPHVVSLLQRSLFA